MQMIPLAHIVANPDQPRKTFPQEHIERLAASVKARGLIQPITLRQLGGDRYMIVAGECRFRAHQLLGAETIRAEIVDISAEEMALRAIVENLQRKDMNPIEEANAFKTLIGQGYDPPRIVRELGLNSTAIVVQRLQLLELTPDIQRLVASGQIATTMAWGVSQVSHGRQAQLIRDIASGKLRTSEQVKHAAIAMREAEAQIDAFGELPKPSKAALAAVSALEQRIENVARMVAEGFKEGQCIAAQRVHPDRVRTMADQLALIRQHVFDMERQLRCVAAQEDIFSTITKEQQRNEDPGNQAAVGVADRPRTKGRRKQNVADQLSRPATGSRISEAG